MSNSDVNDPLARLRALRDAEEDADDAAPTKSRGTKINIASFDFAETDNRHRVVQTDLFADSGATDIFGDSAESSSKAAGAGSLFDATNVQPIDILSVAAAAAAKSKSTAPRSIVLPLGHGASSTSDSAEKAAPSETQAEDAAPETATKADEVEESPEAEDVDIDPLGVKKSSKVSLFGDTEEDTKPAVSKPIAPPKPAASAALTAAPVTRRSTLFDDDDDAPIRPAAGGLDDIFIPRAALAARAESDRVKHEDKHEAADLIAEADRAAQDALEKFGSVEAIQNTSQSTAPHASSSRTSLFDTETSSLFATSSSKPLTTSLFSSTSATGAAAVEASKGLDDDLFGVLGGSTTTTTANADKSDDLGNDFIAAYIRQQDANTKISLLDD